MKVHLIRSEGIKMEDFNNIFNILNQYSGGITFVPSEPIELPDTDIEITYEDEDDYGRQKRPVFGFVLIFLNLCHSL